MPLLNFTQAEIPSGTLRLKLTHERLGFTQADFPQADLNNSSIQRRSYPILEDALVFDNVHVAKVPQAGVPQPDIFQGNMQFFSTTLTLCLAKAVVPSLPANDPQAEVYQAEVSHPSG